MTDRRQPRNDSYLATEDELGIIDEAIASLDAGEVATEAEIKAVFAKFRSE
jgi:hypothetical protein